MVLAYDLRLAMVACVRESRGSKVCHEGEKGLGLLTSEGLLAA
jgi:hypothetical protein